MLNNYIVYETDSIANAIDKITHNEAGTVFVVNKQINVLGVIADGEVRQAYLNDISTCQPCTTIMKKDYYSVNLEALDQDYSDLVKRFKLVPVINEGKLIDVISRQGRNLIPISKPTLQHTASQYVNECLKTNWISSQGEFVNRFENLFASYTGLSNAVSVSNGTTALELALLSLGIGRGDEVIVPDFTFGATVNAVIAVGACPVIVDVDPETWLMDIELVLSTISDKTKAIICVDIYGQPYDVAKLRARLPTGIKIIQDSAESLSAEVNGKHTGLEADAVTFSFFANKIITTGEGGMVCFLNRQVKDRAELIKNHGMSSTKKYVHMYPGRNLRMTNIQAAIGCSQIENIGDIVKRRQRIFENYRSELADYLCEPRIAPGMVQAPWLYSGLVGTTNSSGLMKFLKLNNIDTRPLFSPMHMQPAFSKYSLIANSGIALNLHNKGISLPTFNELTQTQQEKIITYVKRYFDGNRSI